MSSLVPLPLLLLLVTPAAAGSGPPAMEDEQEETVTPWPGVHISFHASRLSRCREAEALRASLGQTLGAVAAAQGAPSAFVSVRLSGLSTLSETQIWSLLGEEASLPRDADAAARLMCRLAATGVFGEVTPSVSADPDGGATAVLELALHEYPRVVRASVSGSVEASGEELLEAALEEPDDDEEDEEGCTCQVSTPPRDWLAFRGDGALHPGLLRDGLPAVLQRAMRHLRGKGYLLASVSASVVEGTLTFQVDEGKLAGVDVTGVAPELQAQVTELLALKVGAPFLEEDFRAGVHRVQARFPFLEADDDVERPGFDVVPESGTPGTSYRVVLRARKSKRNEPTLSQGRLQVHFHFRRGGFDAAGADRDGYSGLLTHTQVTSFAPGMRANAAVYDPQDRFRLALQGSLSVNTGSPDHRVDGMVGASGQVSALHLEELGFQAYSMTDSDDRWRVSDLDSSFGSLFLNQPEREYFRREGVSGFASASVAERILLGFEYRDDQYGSLAPAQHFFSFFNNSGPAANPAIDDGRMASAIFRLEASTRVLKPTAVALQWRSPTTALYADFKGWALDEELDSFASTLSTFEVGGPAWGGDSDLRFTRFLNEDVAQLKTFEDQAVRLRLRFVAGHNVPLQKSEALGGWGSLRGYDFKEFPGDASAMGTLEYRYEFATAFADLGTVHQPGGWLSPKLGVGVSVGYRDILQLAAAWRTDSSARAMPEMRLVILPPF
jgi:hypothetical protein